MSELWTEERARAAEEAIGYRFRDRALLRTCFTHATYANEHGGESNERLEFLGDAVLQLAVTEALYGAKASDEGKLTELRKQFVSKPALERAEARLGLMRFLLYAGGESNVGGKTASNLMEAVIGGVYLDGGFGAAQELLGRCLEEIESENHKTRLQEYVQGRIQELPRYEVQGVQGRYECVATALGKSARGEGESKKAAETAAAKALLRLLAGEERG